MMGGGQNRGEIVNFVVAHRPGSTPGSSACQSNPTPAKPRQSATPGRSILRPVYVFGRLRHQKLNEHAPTEMPVCWILLDMGRLGLIITNQK